MPDLAPGTQLASRYTVERLLGRGAMKEVYLARDEHTGIHVAVALLSESMRRDPTVSARFSREGRTAAALRSPYAVRVFDVGKLADGTRYLVTEAVLGRDVGDALEHGPVDPFLAAQWTAQVLAALSEAHARGVLHRDVKPENVLLAPGPHGETAKLTDFGLAKVLDTSLEGSVMLRTAQNALLGTPDYMPPEQWQALPLDGRADVYATGAMLFELLSGRAPFRATALHEFCVAHVTLPVPPLPQGLAPLAYALEPVVRRALEKQPNARYPSADAMRADIEAIAGVLVEPSTLVRPGDSLAPPPPRGSNPVPWSSPAIDVSTIANRASRTELVCDAWTGVVQLLRGESAVLGREGDVDVTLRCLPPGDEATARMRVLSRKHARIAWDAAQHRATIEDLGSRAGTFVLGMQVSGRPMALRNGDEISFGRHVRVRFECDLAHADASPPRWIKLTRTDSMGAEQVHLLVLREAKISAASDAALALPAQYAAADAVRIVPHERGFGVLTLGAPEPVPLVDGQTLRIGGLRISVAIDE